MFYERRYHKCNSACLDVNPPGSQRLHEGVEQPFRLRPTHGAVEARPAAAADRPRQGELRHGEDRTANLVEPAVHPAGVVLEHTQRGHLAGRAPSRLEAVADLDPDEDHEPRVDPTDSLATDADLGT